MQHVTFCAQHEVPKIQTLSYTQTIIFSHMIDTIIRTLSYTQTIIFSHIINTIIQTLRYTQTINILSYDKHHQGQRT